MTVQGWHVDIIVDASIGRALISGRYIVLILELQNFPASYAISVWKRE